jgi:hypothetical protein
MRSTRRTRALRWLLPLCSSSAVAAPPDDDPGKSPEGEEPIRLEYRPAAGCPSKDALVASLRASTPRFRFAGANEPARSFTIDAEAGRLTIRDVSGQTAVREVTGETCSEAVAALTFVAALAIDPNAVPAASATAAPNESSATSSPAPERGATPNPAPPPVLAPATLPPPAQPPAAETAPPLDHGETRFTTALRGGLITGVARGPTGMGRFSVELSRVTDGSFWSPSVALSVALGATREVSKQDAGTAELTWTTGRLDACMFRFPARLASPWELRLGPFFEAGVLAGRAPTAPAPTPKDTGWFAFGGVGRFALRVAGPVSLEAETGLGVPILQYRFTFVPGSVVYEVPPVSFSAAAGIAVRFW